MEQQAGRGTRASLERAHSCAHTFEAELRSAEASRRLGALDLRMSGVQGGLGEHKRDILKLREAGGRLP